MLRRRRLVDAKALTPPVRRSAWQWLRRPLTIQAGLSALQAELVQRGLLLSVGLYRYCASLSAPALAGFGGALLDLLDGESGFDTAHTPLFRGYPETVPADTESFYVNRIFAQLLQEPDQPCVLCGDTKSVHAVSPCAHLVCRMCWDGADFGACPLCLRRIDPADPFLEPSFDDVTPAHVRSDRLRLLSLATADSLRHTVGDLLTRRTPLSASDRADLQVLLDGAGPAWLPDEIPVRETKALAVAQFLYADPDLIDRAGTATDVLRVLYALMDADPGLRTAPARRQSLPRATRRSVLQRLDRLPVETLVEDMRRHERAWKRIGENLHPFEFATRFPSAALAFAVLRRTALDLGTAAGRAVAGEASRHPLVRVEGGRLVMSTFASRVEAAFTRGRPEQALELLRQRPGDLVRRLLQVARALPPEQHGLLVDALTTAVSDVSPAVLTAALGQVRTPPGDLRLFFPRGGTARIWTAVDDREPLPSALSAALSDVLTAEMLRRAHGLPRWRRAFLDEELTRLAAPGSERNTSSSLLRITRGSAVPIPQDELLRLFLHWVEPRGRRVDLDLSVAVFDEEWAFRGLCDYTRLRFDEDAVVHSGDLTSAPGPGGSTEFVDIDLRAVRRVGGRYLVPVVFSYNDVPFDELERGFVGVMRQPNTLFDPAAVEERFDLAGPAKILMPFGVDLHTKDLRWYDVNLGAAGYGHNIARYGGRLGLMAATMEEVHGSGDRVSLWEICCWHAAARTDEIAVRCAGAEVYALHPRLLDGANVALIDAPYLLSALAPDARAHASLSPSS
ncbi:MXAN_6230/SCO0854 family RING domain-containing protein [Kribbella sp. NPDC048915]|uniref:MXAN_6230/SCO0854 family RING domain-containing protein n=1 Tax=Kribbella sp. NPDC048915 TaxID=3155148 RepID=UPI0033FE8D83